MNFNRFTAFTVGVAITVVSAAAISYVNAAGDTTIKACINKSSGVMRYLSKGKCKQSEKLLSWNQSGPQGIPGAKGEAGPSGIQGTPGLIGPTGPKGDSGVINASSPTGFADQNVCGPNGTSLCAIGTLGPGGGTIFFVDSANEVAEYDYLEVAPENACVYTCVWSTNVQKCGSAATQDCQASYLSDAGSALDYQAMGAGREATLKVIARHRAGNVANNLYAAGAAVNYATTKASDWWLPSKDELNELCKFARRQATGDTAVACASTGTLRDGFTSDYFWSSSEGSWADAAIQNFDNGFQTIDTKSNNFTFVVRAIRGF